MDSLNKNRRTGAKSPLWSKFASFSKRFLYLMAACMAAMTLAACIEIPADPDDGGGDNGGDDGGGGGVSGKRIKSWVQETSRPSDYIRVEYTYNSDGSIKQVDQYNASGHYTKGIYTNNSDGTTKD